MSSKVIFLFVLLFLVLSFDASDARKRLSQRPRRHTRHGRHGQHWRAKRINTRKTVRPKVTTRRPKLYFFISNGLRNGPFAVLEKTRNPKTTYQLVKPSPDVTINRNTGVLKWIRPRHKQKRHNKVQNLQLQVVAILYFRRVIHVNVVILPLFYGNSELDSFLYRKKSVRLLEPDNIFSSSVISPGSLHRFMRKLPDKMYSDGFKEAMSSMSVEKSLKVVRGNVVIRIWKTCAVPGDILKGIFLPWNTLFSMTALQRLRTKSECQTLPPDTISCCISKSFRTIDGTCNNLNHPAYGSAPNTLQRLVPAKYFDSSGLNDPLGFPYQLPFAPQVPSAFEVAKSFIIGHTKQLSSQSRFSHALMQWGQWLDHDLGLSPESEGGDFCQNINACDVGKSTAPPCFNLQRRGNKKCLPFVRSLAACPLNKANTVVKREQVNVNTAFIDGSQIYGSTEALAKELRDKNGFLKVTKTKSGGDLLPFDTSELMAPVSFCRPFGGCFLAGDTRVNEQQALVAMHTLFVREHNRIVKILNTINPHWDGERKYQEARKIVGSVLQKITYEDYLPLILGTNTPRKYTGFKATVDPGILNSFSTAAYRFGHSSIRPTFDLLNANFDPILDPVPLRQIFFNNTLIKELGIEPLLLGLIGNSSQSIDRKIASDLLENLFVRPNSPGLNLAALNIQRGRDHGLPGYDYFRTACGLPQATKFYNGIKDAKTREILNTLYKSNQAIADLWVAGLAEDPVNGGTIGPTFQCIIKKQLELVRDGDRFFYENDKVFDKHQLAAIRKVSLSRIYCDNLKTVVSIQRNAFLSGSTSVPRVSCDQIDKLDLTKWKESKSTTQRDPGCGRPTTPSTQRPPVVQPTVKRCRGRRCPRVRTRTFAKRIRFRSRFARRHKHRHRRH